ncbi:hypothetical protein BDP81DRAFT_426577 [Colletotrichum phormii]|uniref:Secreted protein n=1 Tax=Colletotrichum phormii TaxID=359342 RepID=A0AAI9ZRW2_9PEZI|nr:uncharacterized protein BDP81DRAFT_426577 [Colletotrichum phormii]KAK1637070.1 hypothetical protein BDP81DRAFT_426577 [Colletotrichum phormii]
MCFHHAARHLVLVLVLVLILALSYSIDESSRRHSCSEQSGRATGDQGKGEPAVVQGIGWRQGQVCSRSDYKFKVVD